MSKKERILVTSALPYANGPLHIGHAIGAYIPADVYVRYHRLKGNDVVYISGTDEHGTPIAVTADNEGITPQEVVDKYYKIIKKAFYDLGISFDNFSRTSRKEHHRLSQEFFLNIMKNGFIYKKIVERPYCTKCRRFLPDRYVRGICPFCGANDQRGDQCEICGKQLEPHELKKYYCTICRGKPVMKKTEHWFFRLSAFADRLEKWIYKNKHWPDNARNFSLGWLKEGLKDRAITRDLDWGVPLPVEGSEGKVLYVWFDAPIGYISSTIEWARNKGDDKLWMRYWMEKECKIVHFIGKDNIPFHAIIWPAMLMAHKDYNLPWQISSNEYLNLEGKKMSTSRSWVIWLHDILSEFPADYLRYYLLAINPAKHDADFSLREFQHRINSELISTLGNFIHRTFTFIKRYNNGIVPEEDIYTKEDKDILRDIENYTNDVAHNIENFRFSQALFSMMNLAHRGNEYFQHKEPWKKENTYGTTLFICANIVRTLSILMFPFIPFSAEKTWKMLNLDGKLSEQRWEDAARLSISSGHRIGKITTLFSKIDDSQIDRFIKKYLKSRYIKYDDFKSIDIRIGEITNVEEHPNADKLYLLNVNLGDIGKRQVVAKIKDEYTKDDLIGKQVVLVVNLESLEIRGKKSEGMLLAADVNGKPILLIPDKTTKIGAKVR